MREFPKLLISDKKGNIFDVSFLEATGMKGGEIFRLDRKDFIKLHPDSELFMLPSRKPVGFDREFNRLVEIEEVPFSRKNVECYAVAAFVSPGYTVTYNAAYAAKKDARILPLFSYAAVALYKNEFYAAAVRIDGEKRQELAGMDCRLIEKNVKVFRKTFPKNRLVRHLETCALIYGCPAAKNFFLQRYEAPLPASPSCNAGCIGCISKQNKEECSVTQPRISFVPTPEEIAEAAIFHIKTVKDPVVSFGQGCEGEPLTQSETLIKAVKIIRKVTSKGMINLNTNASYPDVIGRLFDAGLNSIRVSMNSSRERYYSAYYNPKDYKFSDVVRSIKTAKKNNGFVSINYLTMPGFTDLKREVKSFMAFVGRNEPDMIQWRNLNYDPLVYFKRLEIKAGFKDMIGIDTVIDMVKKEYPNVTHGYFNPSKGRIKRNKNR
ncbi:MAG: radical SAM protein [Candidatus Omnitrophica bacterium]|nr:radical SAM protein [Candidatus Omnitrophota bacterium]